MSEQESFTSKNGISLLAILTARCPFCRKGSITRNFFWIHKRCEVCDYDLYPESGYYLGAMVIGYLVSAMLMIPVIVALKLTGARVETIVVLPIALYLVLGPIVIYYARVIWLHVEYRMTRRLDGPNNR